MALRITINKGPTEAALQPLGPGRQSFVRRRLELTIQLATRPGTNQPITFAGTGRNTTTISGTRTRCRIQNAGSPSAPTAQIDVFGLAPDLLDQLSTLGMQLNLVPKNSLTVQAGDSSAGLTQVYGGTIVNAYADYNSAPDVSMHFECETGLDFATTPATASSFTGSTDVATIMASYARQMNLTFENNGVSVQLKNAYYSGSLKTQYRQCADDANINAEIVNGNTLAIWPKFGSRPSTSYIPLISPDTGMIDYPSYTQQGILVKTLFNPLIIFGGKIKVKSSLTKANGEWIVQKLDHALDSQVEGGHWQSMVYGYSPNNPNVVIPPP